MVLITAESPACSNQSPQPELGIAYCKRKESSTALLLKQSPAYPEPTLAEVTTAISGFKGRKAAGLDNRLPEMLKYGGNCVAAALHSIILGAWRSEQAPPDFKHDILIRILRSQEQCNEKTTAHWLCSQWQPKSMLCY